MVAEPLLVGVDVGTTNIKAIVFNPRGQVVARASTSTPTRHPRPAWADYDPEALWQQTVSALRTAVGELDDVNRIVSIAVASMAETAVPLDGRGQPTFDAVAWFDLRAAEQAGWLDETIGQDRLFAISGLSLQPIFGLCKLLWLKQNEPEAFERTALWLNVADYIAYRLCGVAATDYSLASRILTLDLRNLRWDEDLLAELEIPASLFAPLRPSGTVLGRIRAQAAALTGLPGYTQVVVGGHDHVCGALATGVIEPGSLLNSVGTSEAIFLPVKRPLSDPAMGRQGYAQGAHVVPDRYFAVGGLYTSGICVDWFRDLMGGDVSHASLIAEAEMVPPGSLGVSFLPYLRLANSPIIDPKARGAFVGLTIDAGRGAIFRALLEGLAFGLRHSLDALLVHANVDLERVFAIGGGTRNRLHMRIKATMLKQAITVLEMEEATALGAALLGGLGVGIYRDANEALGTLQVDRTVVEPIGEQIDLYERHYQEIYLQMYPALKSLNHAIDRVSGR
ncbi:MAG: FGGY family carbohydrate kinase [Chloroflexota bacterium]|nr:FGGY family carbohydrate kinase [Chloroflexota bacterium]